LFGLVHAAYEFFLGHALGAVAHYLVAQYFVFFAGYAHVEVDGADDEPNGNNEEE
jgi:hypothetical protein